MAEPRCYICNQAESDDPENVEIRPYGVGGRPICFDCMTADPVREAEARKQFSEHCDRVGGGGMVVLGDGAPRAATFDETELVAYILPGLPRPSRA